MKCIFIGGCGRSGTTFLGSLIGASKEVITTPESDFIKRYYLRSFYEKKRNKSSISLAEFLKDDWRFKQWNTEIPSEFNHAFPKSYNELGLLIKKLVKSYASVQNKFDIKFWVDHSPKNISEAYFMMKLFPDAKFIHIVRDPRAVFASVKKVDWGPNTALKSSEWWNYHVGAGLGLKHTYPDKVLTIKYEKLVSNPEKIIQDICNHCEIRFESNMLDGKGFNLPNYTKDQHYLVGKAINKSRIDSWKKELSPKDIDIIEANCHPLIQSFAYKSIYEFPMKSNLKAKIISAVLEILFLIPNRIKKKIREKKF